MDRMGLGGGDGGGGDALMGKNAGGELGAGEAANSAGSGEPAHGGVVAGGGKAGEALAEGFPPPIRPLHQIVQDEKSRGFRLSVMPPSCLQAGFHRQVVLGGAG